MDKIRPTKRLGDDLYRALSSMIENSEIAEGSRLPAETELAERFGVSRPTVRETLARLRDEGLIASRRGSGSYVQARPLSSSKMARQTFQDVDSFEQIKQCYEFRKAVEGEAAFLAARALNDLSLAELNQAVVLLDQSIAARAVGAEADFNFHLTVAKASRNSWFVSAMEAMRGQIQVTIEIARRLSLNKSNVHVLSVQAEHIAIFDAIKLKDGTAARELMREHLDRTCNRIFRGSTT